MAQVIGMIPRDVPDTPVVLGPIGSSLRHSCEQILSSYAGVNKGVNASVNANCTTQPDPPHNSYMSPTQPHMHGKCTGGLHSHGLHHLSSHLSSHIHVTRMAGPSQRHARLWLPCGSADDPEARSDPALESAHAARCGYLNGEIHRARRYAADTR